MKSRYREAALPDLVDTARTEGHPQHEDAFAEIVRRFRAHAQASAYQLVRDVQLAEDVAQDAFLDAYLGLVRLRDPAAFPGWFRRIVFKHADRIRRRPRVVFLELSAAEANADLAPSPEAETAARENAAQVRTAMLRLPEHERVVVVLFYFAQQSHAEIGERLLVPVSTVKKRLHDARRHLRIVSSDDRGSLFEQFLEAAGPEPARFATDESRPLREDREATVQPNTQTSRAPLARVLGGTEALTLASIGTPETREVLRGFAPEQLAGALQELSAADQVAFLEVAERLPEIVPCLPEVLFTHTMRSVGLEDAGWLVEFASPEQRVAGLDLDCWRNGRLSPGRLFDWIDSLIEAGTETLLAGFDDIDAEIWIVALKSMAEFSIPASEWDGMGGDPWADGEGSICEGQTDDGVVFYEPTDSDHEERLRTILNTARIYAPSLYWDFVYGAINEPARSCEEAATRWHAGRLNDLGFPDPDRAKQIYRPLRVEAVPIVESLSAPPVNETPVPHVLSGTSLGRALAELPGERAAEIQGQLFALANAIAVADGLPLSQGAALEYALGKALQGVDRGLVALATSRHRSLAETADTNLPRDLFRIGATLSPELRRPQHTFGELEELEIDAEELDWSVGYEWLSEADETLDADGRPR